MISLTSCHSLIWHKMKSVQGSNKRHTTSSFATRAMRRRNFAMRRRNFCEKARCELIEPHSCHRAADAAISARRRGTAVSITRDTRFHGVAWRLPGSSPPPTLSKETQDPMAWRTGITRILRWCGSGACIWLVETRGPAGVDIETGARIRHVRRQPNQAGGGDDGVGSLAAPAG